MRRQLERAATIASAMSSADSGSAHVLVDRRRLAPVAPEAHERELVGLDHARRDLDHPDRLAARARAAAPPSSRAPRTSRRCSRRRPRRRRARDRGDGQDVGAVARLAPRSRSSGSSALVTRLVPSTLTSNIRASPRGRAVSTLAEPQRAARVVDEGVHRAELARGARERIHVGLLREVGDEHVGSGLGGERLEPVGAAGDAHDIPAVRAEQRTVAAPIPELAPVTTTTCLHPCRHCCRHLSGRLGWKRMTARCACRPRHADRRPEAPGPVLGQRALRLRHPRGHRPRHPAAHRRLRQRAHRLPVHLRVPHAGVRDDQRLLLEGDPARLAADEEGAHRHPAPVLHLRDDLDRSCSSSSRASRSSTPTSPSWTLWFLLALGIFRLILPYLALLRWPLLWAVRRSRSASATSPTSTAPSRSRARSASCRSSCSAGRCASGA